MRKNSLFILAILFTAAASHAQMLSGKVTAERGYAASKVEVSFVNKTNKVVTNIDGTFKIMATKLPDTLVFSSPGYEPYKVVITEKNISDPNFEVVLLEKRGDAAKFASSYSWSAPASATLSEVVVTGYGAKKSKRKYKAYKAIDDRVASGLAYTPGVTTSSSSSFKTGSYLAATSPGYYNGKKVNMLDSLVPNKDGTILRNSILTAGEVNDFYKWKMWEDLAKGEFDQWSRYWGMYTTKRYVVQLQNNAYAAVINQPVYLKSKKTDKVVWSAITDNTGKAELWANFSGKEEADAEYYIEDAKGNKTNDPVIFEKGVNHLQSTENCGASNAVDIAFVVDATGSMGDEIEFLKFEMEDVMRKTFGKYNKLDIKVGSVFYRDRGDEYVTKYIDMQNDLLKVLNFVKLQRDGGGGDEPEAVDSAMDVAINKLSWRKEARTRIMFLFLDAPAHDYAREDVYKLVEKAAKMGIRIVPVACSGAGKTTEFMLRSIALATNGTYAFLTDHSGVGGKHTEASTDSYDVELLNNLMQRVIEQFIYVKECSASNKPDEPFVHEPVNVAKLKIYPNPTQGKFVIESDKELKEIFVSDFTGKLLMKLTGATKGRWEANISSYPSGTYLVRYITAENKMGAEKIVLIH